MDGEIHPTLVPSPVVVTPDKTCQSAEPMLGIENNVERVCPSMSARLEAVPWWYLGREARGQNSIKSRPK